MTHRDPLRRLTPTPFAADVRAMRRTVHLETNDPVILSHVNELFNGETAARSAKADFLWRIVSENQEATAPSWPKMTAFSDRGLRYVNLGQRNFFAVDLESREGVSFVSRALAHDAVGFASVLVATLFDMTAGALGLTLIPAACVSSNGHALLIFGPPRSGKTTSGYWAGRSGLEFHSDQAVYLDFEGDRMSAWGQFWPAAFRPDVCDFMPELAPSLRPFGYGPMKFLCPTTDPANQPLPRSLSPVACVFLERNAAKPSRLIRLRSSDYAKQLRKSLPFVDDPRFSAERDAALEALDTLPAFNLQYGADPVEAVAWYQELLNGREKMDELC